MSGEEVKIPAPVGLAQLPISKQPGIYFLYNRGTVVYVGQSVDVAERVGRHLQEGAKEFDAAAFLPCPVSDLNKVERRYIERMAPRYNQCRLSKFMRRACPDRLSAEAGLNSLLGTEEAAAFLSVSVTDFRELRVKYKGLKACRVPRRNKKAYRADDLREWALTNNIKSFSAPQIPRG